jgi:uncharacterized protein YndB with AHSA1/START domain
MVARDVTLPVDREAAWDALTDPDALAQWLGEPSRLELEPGGVAAFTLRNGEERHAVVEEVQPGERLVFWWWEPSPDGPDAAPDAPGTRVEFTLADAVSGTRITVTEAPVGPLAQGGLCHLATA